LGLTLLLFVIGVSGDYALEQNWAGANFFLMDGNSRLEMILPTEP